MQRERLESAATEYAYLRGLFGIPLGLLFVLAALGNWHVGPLRHNWVFLAGVLLLAAACLPIRRFYDEHYGRVVLSSRQQRRGVVAALVAIPVVFGVSFLLRSRVGWSLDLPVNPIAISMAALTLLSYAVTVGARRHHVILFGALFAAGALPVWTGGDPSNVGLVLTGAAVILSGCLDHRLLVRTLGPATPGMSLANGDVGA